MRYSSPRAEGPLCDLATIATAVAHAERHGAGRLDLVTRRAGAGADPLRARSSSAPRTSVALSGGGPRWLVATGAAPGRKVSRRRLAVTGLGLMAVGLGVLSQLGPNSSYWVLLVGILPAGAGMAFATALATTDIVTAVPANKQGVASAVNDAAREVGGTLGIAVLGSLLNQQYRTGVSDSAPADAPGGLVEAARESLAAALGIADRFGARGTSLAEGARNAFVDGMELALVVSAASLFVLAVVFAIVLPSGRPTARPDGGSEFEDDATLVTLHGR